MTRTSIGVQRELEQLRETRWHSREVDEVLTELDTDPERGLAADEAAERLTRLPL